MLFVCVYIQTADGKIVLNLDGLKELMSICDCDCVTDTNAGWLLKEIDVNKDGCVDFDEFTTVECFCWMNKPLVVCMWWMVG